MGGVGARVAYLMRRQPALALSKIFQHAKRRWHFIGAKRQALRQLRESPTGAETYTNAGPLESLARTVPVVVLERHKAFVRCGVVAACVPTALSILWRDFPDAVVMLDGRPCPANRGIALNASRNLTHVAATLPRGNVPPCIRIDVFDPTETGSFVNRNETDRLTGVLYGDLFPPTGGIVDLTQRLPELTPRANQLEIDVVYTWVDNRDAEWLRGFTETATQGVSSDAVSEARFRCNDELRYSLRSLYLHMPWVDKIHIVSSCQPPDWLDPGHPRLRWIPHQAILPYDCLPTFNSHAIETSLHRVPGVTENFIYLNDDFFVLDDLSPADFVNENGTLNANLEEQAVVNAPPDPAAPDYLNAARNSARLLFERYGYYPTRLHKHAPYSLSRSLLEELETQFEHAFAQTRKARVRSITDVSVPSFMAHHYGFIRGAVVYSSLDAALIKSNDPFSLLKMEEIARGDVRPKMVCLNEGGLPEPQPGWHDAIVHFMAALFAAPAPWERGG